MIPRDGFATEPGLPSEKHPLGTTEGSMIFIMDHLGDAHGFSCGCVITFVTVLIGF